MKSKKPKKNNTLISDMVRIYGDQLPEWFLDFAITNNIDGRNIERWKNVLRVAPGTTLNYKLVPQQMEKSNGT